MHQVLELVHHGGLLRVVGVHVEAERPEADLVETLLHHLQSGALLRHEEHALPSVQGVGDDVRDGLALARARRAVEDEAPAVESGPDSLQLRGVRADGEHDVPRGHRPVEVPVRIHAHAEAPVHDTREEAVDNWMGAEHLRVVVYVVPHQELREVVDAERHRLVHVPAAVLHHAAAHDVEHLVHVHAPAVLRQRAETGDLHLIDQTQLLQEGGVEHRVLLPPADGVAAGGAASHYLDRHEQQRSVTRLVRVLRLVPLERAEGEVERVRAGVLRVARLPVELLQALPELVLPQIGTEPAALQVGLHGIVRAVSGRQGAVPDGIVSILTWVDIAEAVREAEHAQALARGQAGLQPVQVGGDKLDAAPARTGVDEAVAHGEVQQLPLPEGLLVHHDLLERIDLRGAALYPLRPGVEGLSVALPVGVDVAALQQRQGTHVLLAGLRHVDEELELLACGADRALASLDGLVEGELTPLLHARRLEKEDVVDAPRPALREKGHVAVHAVGERAVDEPAAHAGVTSRQHDERVDARGLEAARVEKGHVKARRQTPAQHLVRQADALSALFEARRRAAVRDALLRESLVDSAHRVLHSSRQAGLITVQCRAARPSSEYLGGAPQHRGDGRVVGRDERGDEIGTLLRAHPLVEGQQGDGVGLPEDLAAARDDDEVEGALDALREGAEDIRREDRPDAVRRER